MLKSSLFALFAVASAKQDSGYVLHSNANLVVLDVAAENRRGRPKTGLTKEQFAVFEDGRRQAIKHFTSSEAPVSVGLVLDMSGSMSRQVEGLRRAVEAFLEASNSLDEYFVVGFNDRPRFSLPSSVPFSTDSGQIRSVVAALRPEGMTSLYDGAIVALNHIEKSKYERRVLVLISDGKDTASQADLAAVLRRVRSTSVTIYTVGLFEEGDPDQNSGVLKQIARISGGRYFHPENTQDIQRDCVRIAREIRARYTLSYTPTEDTSMDRIIRRIKVSVVQPPASGEKLIVRARTEISMEATNAKGVKGR